MVEIFKKTKVATKNKAVFNKAICANEIKYMGINSIVSNISFYRGNFVFKNIR